MKIFLNLLLLLSFCSISIGQTYLDIDVHAAKDTIQNNQSNANFTILDVRTAAEYLPEHIEGAVYRDFYATDFQLQLDSLDKTRIFLIYCRSGNRSGQTLTMMKDLGFETVYNMLGGMSGWNNANYPVTDVIPPYVDIYQKTTGLYELELFDLSVFPNPTSQTITLKLKDNQANNMTYKVFSLNGMEVSRGVLNESSTIDISSMNNGIYSILTFKENILFSSTNIIKH